MKTIGYALFTVLLSSVASWAQVATPQPATSQWVVAQPGTAKGKVEERTIESKVLGGTRRFWSYVPAGYDESRKQPYDLIVAFDGEEYVSELMPLPTILDNLIAAGKIQPMVGLFVDNGSAAARLADLANGARFAEFLSNELIPFARRRWNVSTDPRRTIVTGSSAGGLGAAYVAYKRPDVFGNVLAQSGAFWRGNEASNGAPYEWLTEQFRKSPRLPINFYLEVGALETRRASGSGPIFIEANRRFRDVLQAKGYTLFYAEIPGAQHEAGHWRNQVAEGILWLTAAWNTGAAAK